MPELPEVQTVVNNLATKIIGKVFKTAQVNWPKSVSPNFIREIAGQKVKKVFRRAKMIVIEFESGKYLIVHLKMTGQLIYVDRGGQAIGGGHPIESNNLDLTKPNKFTQVILNFTDGSQLLFHDVRKFGWLKIVSFEKFNQISNKHGLEPLEKEFSLSAFNQIIQKRSKAKIKQLIMNQELVVGIGNIYADESLFEAKISPLKISGKLLNQEIKILHQSIIKKLKQAVSLGGTSVNTFVNLQGRRGEFVKKLKVYQRGGLECVCCKSILLKTKIGGRGTVYCCKCQKIS